MGKAKSGIDTKKAIKVIQQVAKVPYIHDDSYLTKEFQAVIKRLEDRSFRIAIVGEFSSGKSTFINALLGRDILKHGVQETTATITEIVNDKFGEKAEILFSDGKVKTVNSFADLAEYTATSSKSHKVADEIIKVTLHTPVLAFDEPVVFIDTPGLNGIADKHREKTIDIIQKAHACIYLLQKRGLGDSDTDFIKLLTQYQQQFLFVQNFIDTLQVAEGETPEEKMASQQKLLDSLLKDSPQVSYQLVGVSALDALRAQDPSADTETLSKEERQKVYAASRLDSVKQAITAMVRENKKNSQQQRTAISIALQRLHSVLESVQIGAKQAQKDWDASAEGKSEKKKAEVIELLKKNTPIYQKKIDEYIISESARIKRQSYNDAEKIMEPAERDIGEEIDSYTDIKKLQQYVTNNGLANLINRKITQLEKVLDQNIQAAYTHLYQNAILQIKAYSGQSADIEIHNYQQQKIDFNNQQFEAQAEDEEITSLKAEIQLQEQAQRQAESQTKQIQQNKQDIEKMHRQVQSDSRTLENQLQYEKNYLGSRPQAIRKSREETYYRDRTGLFSGLTNALFGQKKDTRTVYYDDDSRGEAWDREYNQLMNEYNKQRYEINDRQQQLNSQKAYLEDKLRRISGDISQIRDNIDQLKEELITQENWLKTQAELSRKKYLAKLKGDIKNNVRTYFTHIVEDIRDSVEKACDSHTTQIQTLGQAYYQRVIQQRLAFLESDKADAKQPPAQLYQQYQTELTKAIHELKGLI